MNKSAFVCLVSVVGVYLIAIGGADGLEYYNDTFNDSSTSKDLYFDAGIGQLIYLNIPRRVNVTTVNVNATGSPTTTFQETANSYSCSGGWSTEYPCANTNDTDEYTAGSAQYGSGLFANISSNWTKPTNANGMILSMITNVGYGNPYYLNFSLLSTCFASNTRLYITVHNVSVMPSSSIVEIYCWNGTWNNFGGFMGPAIREDSVYWTYYPSNITMDIGRDGSKEYVNRTTWNITERIYMNSTAIAAINNYLYSNCTSDWGTGYCDVPLNITSATNGTFGLSSMNISGYYMPPMGLCSSSAYYQPTLNFTFADEESLLKTTGSGEYMMDPNDLTGQVWNGTAINTYNITICSLNMSMNVNMILQYNSSEKGMRYYFLDNATIGGSQNNITLYLLNLTLGDYIDITTQSAYGYPIGSIYVQFQRYYIGNNTYRTVAMARSDDRGTTEVFLRTNNIWYKETLTQGGIVLRTLGPEMITTSSLTLSTTLGEIATWENYDSGIYHSCSYDGITEYLTCDVTDPTGLASQVCLDVDEINVMNMSDYGLTCGTGPSMTLMMNLSDAESYNKTVRYLLYAVGSPKHILEEDSLTMGYVIAYGLTGILATIMIFCVAAGTGRWNPMVSVLSGILGLVAAISMALFNTSLVALGSLIMVGLILAYKVKT